MTQEGMEVLKDTQDARDWQEAVKVLLAAEIDERASRGMEESYRFLETIHSSIDLFKFNPDMIPGTKGFNRALADEFARVAEPYEIRIDGKLTGYSVPLQPIIDDIRRRNAPAAPAAPAKAKPQDKPQRGISSKAPSSSEKEDFSTLFGTIGLPHLKI